MGNAAQGVGLWFRHDLLDACVIGRKQGFGNSNPFCGAGLQQTFSETVFRSVRLYFVDESSKCYETHSAPRVLLEALKSVRKFS